MKRIDLNCDMGESFGAYTIGSDAEIIQYISSANIACGFHGGDPLVMKNTVSLAIQAGVGIGAHPGFYDLLGFGRRPQEVEPIRLKEEIIYQLGALEGITRSQGGQLRHVKPHGSLNNMAARDKDLALLIAEAIASFDDKLIFVALEGSSMCDAGEEMGLTVAREAYADRAYHNDGHLVSRQIPGSLIHRIDTIVERVLQIVQKGQLESLEGDLIPLKVDTICLHGDTKRAVQMARKIREALSVNGIEVSPLANLLGKD